MKRFLASIIVVFAVMAPAAYARGEGGALSKDGKPNGWNVFGKCVSSRTKGT